MEYCRQHRRKIWLTLLLIGLMVYFYNMQKLMDQAGAMLGMVQVERSNIFFLETSGGRLDARQACCIESASKWNPDSQVHLLIKVSSHIDNPVFVNVMENLKVEVKNLDLDLEFEGTPLGKWDRREELLSNEYRVEHLSDALRLAVLWKYGGLYLDTDIMVLRPIRDFRNSAIIQSGTELCNAIISFDRRHPFLERCLKDFAQEYIPKSWVANGPDLITRNFKGYCNSTNQPCDVTAQPKDMAYKIGWKEWRTFFQPNETERVLNSLSNNTFTHFWNHLSRGVQMYVGQGTAYEELMKINCPLVYSYVQELEEF